MGLYLNPSNQLFENIVRSSNYVDKSGLIRYMNSLIDNPRPLVASSRPRRFGKSLAVQMLAAYYSKACDSRGIFNGLEIGNDPACRKHLNQYDVISLDIQWMKTSAMQALKKGEAADIISYINDEVIGELKTVYPDLVDCAAVSLSRVLADINTKTGMQFVILIDEWDCFFREDKENEKLLDEYVDFLRSLFKGQQADRFIKLAYITGILPIKKYGTQSALNNFRELTMAEPDEIAEYIGFTEAEVHEICDRYKLSFEKMKLWYDGYCFEDIGHIYCPNSVMEAVAKRKFRNYWFRTETYESYDSRTEEAFIPNEEVRSAFVRAVRMEGWADVYQAIPSGWNQL